MKIKEHRKLHAEWYEVVSGRHDKSKEIEFWARCIEASSEPVLELGSGTGSVYVPLLERGFDITGIDTSEFMTARCRAKCDAKGLKSDLHDQSMTQFELPRKFGMVFLPSASLGLLLCDQEIHSTFQHVLASLKPGGLYIYEFQPAIDDCQNNDLWTGGWIREEEDVVLAWRKHSRYDLPSQTWEWLFVVEKFVDGRLVETEANERSGRYFRLEEALQFAQSAGFVDIKANDWLTEDPPRADSKVITVQCRKPGGKVDQVSD